MSAELEQRQREEAATRERVQSYERQAQEAEEVLRDDSALPEASMFSFKPALEKAQHIIEQQKKALAAKSIVDAHNENLRADNDKLQTKVKELSDKVLGIQLQHAEERQKIKADIRSLSNANQNLAARLEETEKFFRWNPSASLMRDEYEREQREEARRKAAEQKQKALEREQQEMHQKMMVASVLRLSPIMTEIVEQGVREGTFATEHPQEKVEFLLAASEFLLDATIFSWQPAELLAKAKAFSAIMETLLGVEPGSFSYIHTRYEEQVQCKEGDGK